jgi:hypothetical protein
MTWVKVLTFGLLVVFAGLMTLNAIRQVSREKTIHIWDAADYEDRFAQQTRMFKTDSLRALLGTWRSLRYSDYNSVGALLLLPFGLIYGVVRGTYVGLVAFIYGGMSLMAIYGYIKEYQRSFHDHLPEYDIGLITVTVVGLCSFFYVPIYQGFWSVGGFPFIIWSETILMRINREVKPNYWWYFLLGILLPIPFFIRRWYFFWVSTFLLTKGTYLFVRSLTKKDQHKTIGAVLMGSISIGLGYIATGPLWHRISTTNYQQIYAAYRINPYSQFIDSLMINYGWLVLAMSVAGMIVGIYKYHRDESWLHLVHLITMLWLFLRIQNLDDNKQYLVLSILVVCLTVALLWIYQKNNRFNWGLRWGVFLLSMYQLLRLCNIMALPPVKLLASYAYEPPVRHDLNELRRLTEDIYKETETQKVYILSFSTTFHREVVVKAARIWFASEPNTNLLWVSDIDKRDSFPIDFFEANYVYLADPVGSEWKPDEQLVVSELGKALVDDNRLGKYYKRLPESYLLDNGLKVSVYKRMEPIEESSQLALLQIFKDKYPEYPEMWSYP